MKQGLVVAAIIAVLAVGMLGCMQQPGSAEIELGSLTVTPDEVMVGERVTISLDVANVGSASGTYEGTLTVGGVEKETKSIVVPGGASGKLTFSLVPGNRGIYDISVDGLDGVLTVKEEVELKYDDGRPDELYGIRILGTGAGYLVRFSPPAVPFTINRVKIYGSLYGSVIPEVQKFEVQIWDNNKQIIHSSNYPYTRFSFTPAWVELEVGDVSVSSDFYVHVCTNATEASGIQVFFDSSVVNLHSEVTREWEIAEDWYPAPPKDEVNWMIRVEGTITGT